MKKYILKNWRQYLLMLMTVAIMASCKSDAFYKERAVNRAREYLLENSLELSQIQREYIKFNKPVLLYENIYGQTTSLKDPFQISITWVVPGKKDALLVYGTSLYNMREWAPIRIIKKQFINKDGNKLAAMTAAVKYAMDNMLFMSDETRNHIRFTTPKFAITHFPLERLGLLSKIDAFGKAKSKKRLAKEQALLEKQEQVSLIYTTDDEKTRVVILGVAGEGMSGWQPVTGIEASTAELKKHIAADLL